MRTPSTSRFPLLLITLLALASGLAQAEPLKVFILSGQSNMVGSGTEAPREFRNQPIREVTLFQVPQQGRPLKRKLVYNTRAKKIASIGPELTFAMDVQEGLGEKIGILKFAIGGRSLATHFIPSVDEAPEDSGRRDHLWAELRRQILAVKKMGDVEFAGMLWLQGERDIKEEGPSASQYADNLRLLIDKVRDVTGEPDLPFIAGRVNPPNPGERFDQVRKGIETGGGAENYAWIDLDEVPKNADNLHYSSEGQLMIGKAFAAKMLEMLSDTEETAPEE